MQAYRSGKDVDGQDLYLTSNSGGAYFQFTCGISKANRFQATTIPNKAAVRSPTPCKSPPTHTPSK